MSFGEIHHFVQHDNAFHRFSMRIFVMLSAAKHLVVEALIVIDLSERCFTSFSMTLSFSEF